MASFSSKAVAAVLLLAIFAAAGANAQGECQPGRAGVRGGTKSAPARRLTSLSKSFHPVACCGREVAAAGQQSAFALCDPGVLRRPG